MGRKVPAYYMCSTHGAAPSQSVSLTSCANLWSYPVMANADKTADPCVMVIFGATGDLTKRKLFPALYNLAKDGHLPENFAIVGVGRQEMLSDEFRKNIIADLKQFVGSEVDKKLLKWFEERTYYTGGDFDDDKKLFRDLKDLLAEV